MNDDYIYECPNCGRRVEASIDPPMCVHCLLMGIGNYMMIRIKEREQNEKI